jgi:hypothetical protein
MNAERIGSVFWFLFGTSGAFVALMALTVFVQSLRSDPA